MSVKEILPKAIIFGLKGYSVTNEERKTFKNINPLGFILFERNCKNFKQTKLLVQELKAIVSHKFPLVMIDQEGGRVARLKKPNWKEYPSAKFFGNKAKQNLSSAKDLVLKNAEKIGKELKKVGINVNCAPVLDVKYDYTHNVIGDRSFSSDPKIVSELGKAFCDGLKKVGIIPILKHIPGHGSSKKDSHKETPLVNTDLKLLNNKDFVPFKILNNELFAMIAHIIYKKIDSSLACESKIIIHRIIRKKIRFKGILISDDITMKAIKGSLRKKVKTILSAGCDIVLHCSGNIKEIKLIQNIIPIISKNSFMKLERFKRKFN